MTRRLIASLLLFAFGLSVPAMGVPARICFTSLCENPGPTCCAGACDEPGTSGEKEAPGETRCCIDEPSLPDSTPPTAAPQLPELPPIDLGWITTVPPLRLATHGTPLKSKARIRGPTVSPEFRPLLAIWRL